MNRIVSFRLCTLTDKELVDAVDKATDEMYKTLDVPTRHIPARPNSDYDLLVGELVQRFIESLRILKTYHNKENNVNKSTITKKNKTT